MRSRSNAAATLRRFWRAFLRACCRSTLRGASFIPTPRCAGCYGWIKTRAAAAQTLRDLFPPDTVADLEHMLRKADRMGSTTSQMETVTRPRRT